LNHGVDVVHATGVGARTHGDNPFRFKHLLIEALNDRRHLDEAGTGNNHEIRLTRRCPDHFGAEARDVVGRREGGGHFHVAARQAEVVRPQGVFTPPVDRAVQHVFELAHEDVFVDLIF